MHGTDDHVQGATGPLPGGWGVAGMSIAAVAVVVAVGGILVGGGGCGRLAGHWRGYTRIGEMHGEGDFRAQVHVELRHEPPRTTLAI